MTSVVQVHGIHVEAPMTRTPNRSTSPDGPTSLARAPRPRRRHRRGRGSTCSSSTATTIAELNGRSSRWRRRAHRRAGLPHRRRRRGRAGRQPRHRRVLVGDVVDLPRRRRAPTRTTTTVTRRRAGPAGGARRAAPARPRPRRARREDRACGRDEQVLLDRLHRCSTVDRPRGRWRVGLLVVSRGLVGGGRDRLTRIELAPGPRSLEEEGRPRRGDRCVGSSSNRESALNPVLLVLLRLPPRPPPPSSRVCSRERWGRWRCWSIGFVVTLAVVFVRRRGGSQSRGRCQTPTALPVGLAPLVRASCPGRAAALGRQGPHRRSPTSIRPAAGPERRRRSPRKSCSPWPARPPTAEVDRRWRSASSSSRSSTSATPSSAR